MRLPTCSKRSWTRTCCSDGSRNEPRLWLLSSIQEFAAERLATREEAGEVLRAHAKWYRELAERADAEIQAGEPEELAVAVMAAEIDNLMAAVDFGVDTGDAALVRSITVALPMYWIMRDRYAEARAGLERALAISDVEDETRVRLLLALGATAYRQGDHPAAIAASDEAADLTMRLGGVADRFQDLKRRAARAWETGELDEAEVLYREALDAAVEVDNGVGISSCRLNLAGIANQRGRHERADVLLQENLPFVQSRGQSRCEAVTLASLGETAVYRKLMEPAADWAVSGARRALGFREESLAAYCLDVAAAALAEDGERDRTAAILGATERARERLGLAPDEDETAIRDRALAAMGPVLDDVDLQRAWARGRELDLPGALELALETRSPATIGPSP